MGFGLGLGQGMPEYYPNIRSNFNFSARAIVRPNLGLARPCAQPYFVF